MDIQKAKELLNLCEREELRDHAFGDREVFWTFGGVEVAGGYFGSTGKSVWIHEYLPEEGRADEGKTVGSFDADEACKLVDCGKLAAVHRNDMQGNDIPNYRGA